MAVRRLITLALLITAACSHGNSPTATPNDFFTAQRAWCRVEQAGIKFDEDDQFDEIYSFSKDGTLTISTAATNDFNQRQWDENALLKTKVVETHPFHADAQHLVIKFGDDERQSTYKVVKRDVDGKRVNCFTMAEFDNVHCPCAISEEK